MQKIPFLRRLIAVLLVGGFCVTAFSHPAHEEHLESINLLLEQFPGKPELYLARAAILVDQGHFDEALEDLDRAEILGLQSVEIPLTRGSVYMLTGEVDLAIENLTMAVTLQAGMPLALALRAKAYELSGQADLAIADWNDLLTIDNDSSSAIYLEAAKAAEEAGNPGARLAIIDQGLNRWPQDSSLVLAGVETLWQQQNHEAAIERLVIQANSATARAYYWKELLAEKLLLLDRAAEAKSALEDADRVLAQKSQLNRSQQQARKNIRRQLATLEWADSAESNQ
jgi:tetratricopeptide (TPR) repeat protein